MIFATFFFFSSLQVVVIAPTRELARQIREEARKFALRSSVKSIVVYGGTSVMYQRELVQKGVNVLIGTPGRLNHFIEEGTINLKKVCACVCVCVDVDSCLQDNAS